MTLDDAHSLLQRSLPYSPGEFYGSAPSDGVGAGMLFENVRFPAFERERRRFVTAKGLVYVVTHECDVDQSNDRPFIDSVLVCPIIDMADLLAVQADLGDISSFLTNVINRNVPRLAYLPTINACPYGGFLYLNKITFTDVQEFGQPEVVCVGAVSGKGLREIDTALQNLLLREKADRLAGMPWPTETARG